MITIRTVLKYEEDTAIKKIVVMLIGIPIYISIYRYPINKAKEEIVKPKRIGF